MPAPEGHRQPFLSCANDLICPLGRRLGLEQPQLSEKGRREEVEKVYEERMDMMMEVSCVCFAISKSALCLKNVFGGCSTTRLLVRQR